MKTYAVVKDGTVLNVVLWDGETEWEAPEGCQAIPVTDGAPAQIGGTYDGETFGPAPAVQASFPI